MNTVVWTTESPRFVVRPSTLDVRAAEWQPKGRGTIPTTQRRKVSQVGILLVDAPEPLHVMAKRLNRPRIHACTCGYAANPEQTRCYCLPHISENIVVNYA